MDKIFVFKIGGRVLDNPDYLQGFLKGFAKIREKKILIHGGGVIAEQMAAKLGVATQMHQGRRITSAPMRDLVTMVYGGLINKSVVATLQSVGCDALGLTGADAGIIRARKRSPEPIDFGFVGDITEVRTDVLLSFLKLGLTPIFAPLTFETSLLNTNADSIASALAESLSRHYEVHMMYCFEQAGVLLHRGEPESLIERLNKSYYEKLLAEGVITDGMLPKLAACFRALDRGTQHIVIAEAMACLAYAEDRPFKGTKIEN